MNEVFLKKACLFHAKFKYMVCFCLEKLLTFLSIIRSLQSWCRYLGNLIFNFFNDLKDFYDICSFFLILVHRIVMAAPLK